MSEFDSAVTAALQPNPGQAARVGFSIASDTNPDAYAEAQRVARRTGVPVDTVLAMPKEMKKQDAVGSIDFDSLAKVAPATAGLLADVEKAKIAHDDHQNLSGIEQTLRPITRSLRAAGAGLTADLTGGAYGLLETGAKLVAPLFDPLAGTLLPENPLRRVAAGIEGVRKGQQALANTIAGDQSGAGFLEQGVTSGFRSFGSMVPGMAASIFTGNPAYALGSGAALAGSQAATKGLDAGLKPDDALTYGVADAAAEYLTEKIPMGVLLKDLKAGSGFFKILGHQVATEVPAEMTATAWQNFNEWAAINPDKPFKTYLDQLPEAEAQTVIATLTMTALTAGLGKGAVMVANRAKKADEAAAQADQTAEQIAKINELAAASKVLQRDPETFQSFVAKAAEDGPVQDVFIDAKTLAQSGYAAAVAAVSPAVAEQLDTALATGGDIRIPVEEYAARIAPTEYAQDMLEHLKFAPEDFSRFEAQEYLKTHAEELKAEVERMMTERADRDTFKQSGETVKNAIKEQLDIAGRFKPEVNDAYASLVSNFYQVMAAKIGITPEALFQKYQMRVGAEGLAGQQFNQADGLEAMRQQMDAAGIKHAVSEKDGVITLSKIIVPESERGAGKGTAAMQALVDYADQTGQHIALTPSSDFGGNKKRLVQFYKRFGFIENKGKNRAFSTSESMYREAPGKALYQGDMLRRAAFSPESLTITLLKNADLSSFLHESGHFFLEVQFDLAAQLQKEAEAFGLDTLKPGEREILTDTSAILQWFGVQSLDQWANMDFEERRAYHERFAESFEAYLFSGEAPSIELQPLFQKFRAWLLNIYRSLKDFIAGHPEAGKLNDEVRAVFDRMLATTEQIQLAEQGRSMMPLFENAEQGGMTPQEFAAYQALGVDASNEAIEELQAKGLRDMQWLHNARGRAIKRLQKESAQLRAETQMEARREVMSQPVYQAWQFLTGKLSADDKIEAKAPPKSDPNVLDETMDSLFVAIAKLGGINKDEAVSTWGTDPADKPQSGVFGKPVWRREEGLSLDGMAEALSQYGYLEKDEHGKVDLRELEQKFSAELKGDTQYSNAYAPEQFAEEPIANPGAIRAGRFALSGLSDIGLPVEIIEHLKALKMTAKEGWHPDMVAERFQFGSGDELVRTLAATPSPKEAIETLTDQMMLARHGELATPEAIALEADKAIHNEVRARFIASEANALAQATGERKILASAARDFARQLIARLKVKDIRPSQYANAEARAGRAAKKASEAGDLATAAAEKRNQAIQVYATRAAYEARDEMNATLRAFKEFANRPDKRLGKSYDLDIANAARAILGEYGIAEKQAKKAAEYLDSVKAYDPEMYGVLSASLQAAEANAKPFKEMTVEEVRGLKDEIEAMLFLAKRSRQMEVDGDLIDRQEIEADLLGRLEEIGIPDAIPGEGQAVTPEEMKVRDLKTYLAAARRMESWVGQIDGDAPMGPFRRFVWSRIKDAADAYRADKARVLKSFREAFEAVAPSLKPQIIAAPELGYTFGKDAGGSAMNEILHALLHTGNASNKKKLLLGRGWAKESQDGALDTRAWDAFISRMLAEGRLTKGHYDFVQSVWDLLESLKPGAQKTHREVFGKYFDEITAEAFTTPFGEYRGGYVPAMVDSRVVQDAQLRELAEHDNAALAYAFPTTPKGFTKSRVEYNRPLLLDLRTLAQHIDKVLLFTHMEMPVRDVQRVLSKEVGQALGRIDPTVMGGLIVPWLNRAAKQKVETPIAGSGRLMRFFSVLRSRAGSAAMFANLVNTAQQITGFSIAAVKVKPKLILSASADYLKSPKKFTRAVAEASPYMANRMDNEVSAMMGEINQILLNPSLLEKAQRWSGHHAYFLQSAVDNVMSPIVWTGAYNQAVEQGLEHRDAVRLADSAVRETQGSSLPEDISRIEAGNAFVRIFTQFAGYFNMQANLLGTEFAKLARDYGLKKGAGRGIYVFALGFLVPALVSELIVQAFRGGPGDDDKDGEYLDDWLGALFMGSVRSAAAMVPVAGPALIGIINAANSKPYDDRLANSPAISMVETSVRAPVSVYKATMGEGSSQKAVRDVATMIAMTLGVPVTALAKPLGYLAGMGDRKIAPTSEADSVRGLVTGVASPDSKR